MKARQQLDLLEAHINRNVPLPKIMHLCYYNFQNDLHNVEKGMIEANIDAFKNYYKDLKKLRSRNHFVFDLSTNSLTFVIDLLGEYFKSKRHQRDRKSIRLQFNLIRNKVFKILHKKHKSCMHCGRSDKLSIDHIIPIYHGGTNNLSNLQILCSSCNSKKSYKISWH